MYVFTLIHVYVCVHVCVIMGTVLICKHNKCWFDKFSMSKFSISNKQQFWGPFYAKWWTQTITRATLRRCSKSSVDIRNTKGAAMCWRPLRTPDTHFLMSPMSWHKGNKHIKRVPIPHLASLRKERTFHCFVMLMLKCGGLYRLFDIYIIIPLY